MLGSREGWLTNDATASHGPADAALPPPLWNATARGGLNKSQLECARRCQERNDCPDGRQAAALNGRSCRRSYPCEYAQCDAWVKHARRRPTPPAADVCRSLLARGPLVRLACRQRTTVTVGGRSRHPCAWELSPFLGPALSCSFLASPAARRAWQLSLRPCWPLLRRGPHGTCACPFAHVAPLPHHLQPIHLHPPTPPLPPLSLIPR